MRFSKERRRADEVVARIVTEWSDLDDRPAEGAVAAMNESAQNGPADDGPGPQSPNVADPRRPRVVGMAALGLAALLVAVAVWQSPPPTSPSPIPPAAPSPSLPIASLEAAPAMPEAQATPNLDEPWGRLDLPAIEPAATLVATEVDRAGVATNTAFTLTSLGATPAVALARAIVVAPSIDLAVEAGANAETATIHPTDPLVPGRLYRFTLRSPDGTVSGSWAFQVQSPLRVVTTLPYNGATDVPVTTGIELTFDQDGTVDAASRFSIEPAVKGRFEQHARTFVFVPERLEPATLYTATLGRGVRLEGSNLALEEDVVVRFETTLPPGATEPSASYQFNPTMEWRPGERPITSVWISSSSPDYRDQQAIGKRPFRVTVYRFSSERAGLDAIRTLIDAPNWARRSAQPVLTTGLARVVSFDATPRGDPNLGQWIRFPAPLERGWYLVDGPRTPGAGQMVLQITDVAGYVAAAKDRLLVWANDIATGGPLDGATVELYGGRTIGRTDSDGLMVTATPPAILDATGDSGAIAERPFMAIRAGGGRSLVIAVGLSGQGRAYSDPAQDRFWRFTATDRRVYRQTDTVNIWGFARDRNNGQVPQDLELRLTSGWSYTGTDDAPPIMSVTVRPDATGAFAESIRFGDLPYGTYSIQLWSGESRIADNWFEVDLIRKPSYQVALQTDRHVLLVGDPVSLTATATFFDGTSVPGVLLTANLFGEQKITTNRAGVATTNARATTSAWAQDWSYASIQTTRAEEGQTSDSTNLLVFPASVRLEGEGTIQGGRVIVTGSLHDVAIDRLERAWDEDLSSVDWNGPAVGGAQVTAEMTELVPVRVRTRQIYDFITKQVVDQYSYRMDRIARGTETLTSGPDGSFRLSVAATKGRDYEVVLSVSDPEGRSTRLGVYAGVPRPTEIGSLMPRLVRSCGPEEMLGQSSAGYAIGDQLCVTARDDRGDLPSSGSNSYLFFTAQRGLRDVVVSTTPKFQARFRVADVPNIEVVGVRFTGQAMVPIGSFNAWFDTAERELTIDLTTDREGYAPRETVTLDVRTTDRAGRPVSASVVLRAVDEKLYAIGAAYDQNPLGSLYGWVGTGMLWTHASHPLPVEGCGGCGDTTGGGDDGRSEFLDSALFRHVTTDATGRARVSFKLSDDLTSWHVSADAMTSVPQAGSGFILVPVGLPFFVDATIAPEYLASDQPIIRLRAYGSGLNDGDPVTFTVTSTSLGLASMTIRGTAFEDVAVPLPRLSVGEHAITIAASSGTGTAALSDRLTRRFTVVESRLVETRTAYSLVTAGGVPEGGPGFTTYVFSDAGRGRYLSILQALAGSSGPRVDQALAAAMARTLLIDQFAVDPDTLPPATFDPSRYQSSGIALLPYSSTDLGLTVRVALLAGDRFDRGELAGALYTVIDETTSTREQRVLAYAGLAGLGEPVLTELQTFAADPALTIRERLYVGLGLAVLGDGATALAIERDLLSTYGERRGPWIRLRVGESLDDAVEATSLLALLSAQLGDPLANDAEGYVDANPAVDELHSLQQAAFIARMLGRTRSAPGRFAYTIDGNRTVVDLDPGETFVLRLVESQRRALSLEPLVGRVGLATSWQVPLRRESVARDASLDLVRTYTPSPTIPDDAMVEVRLTATFGPQVVAGCYEVSDLAPSGLAPMEYYQAWSSPDSPAASYVPPYAIEGQRVSFCVGPSKTARTVKMRYFARIVTAGTYTWEPAVIRSAMAAESINRTTSREVTIR